MQLPTNQSSIEQLIRQARAGMKQGQAKIRETVLEKYKEDGIVELDRFIVTFSEDYHAKESNTREDLMEAWTAEFQGEAKDFNTLELSELCETSGKLRLMYEFLNQNQEAIGARSRSDKSAKAKKAKAKAKQADKARRRNRK